MGADVLYKSTKYGNIVQASIKRYEDEEIDTYGYVKYIALIWEEARDNENHITIVVWLKTLTNMIHIFGII